MRADLALDAWARALCDRETDAAIVHQGDRGWHPGPIRYTELPEEAGIATRMGPLGKVHGNALAKTVMGLLQAEALHRRAPRRSVDDVEYGKLEWVA